MLDRHGRPVPLSLLRQTADAALISGDGEAGEAMLNRAVQQAEAEDEPGGDPLNQARVIAEQADRLITRGEPDQAEQLLRRACQLFTAAGSEREAAVAMGTIADIAYQRGDYDEALRIRREIELPVYERLGDTRSAAVTWGQIADIAYQRGDYDEALRIRREIQLPVYERLGDTRAAAVTWGQHRRHRLPARRLRRGTPHPPRNPAARLRAARRHPLCRHHLGQDRRHRLPARRLRRGTAHPPRNRAARLRAARRHPLSRRHLGQHRRHRLPARRLRRGTAHPPRNPAARLRAARRHPLGRRHLGQIADIAYQRGDYDEALRIRREIELPAYERLGDTRSAAVTWGKIADIAYQRGDYDEALRIRREICCLSTSGSATPVKPPSPWPASPTSPTSAATTTRQPNCSASGWRLPSSSATSTE